MRFAVLIGAHERDNFGDIACSAIMARILRPLPTLKASIISSDMRASGGDLVLPARALSAIPAELGSASAVVFFGGETLACDARSALAMNLGNRDATEFLRLPHAPQERMVRGLTGGNFATPAYVLCSEEVLPASNKDAAIIYHSVGGVELPGFVKWDEQRRTAERNLKQAAYIAVRDRRTRALLSELFGIEAQLFPDSGFALQRVLGDDIAAVQDHACVQEARAAGPYLVFQSSARALEKAGLSRAAARIGETAERLRASIVLQPAGTAWGHDDPDQLARLAALVGKTHPRVRTMVQRDRHFLIQTAIIANASIWIGTSLHGRIFATSMRVPAVSFSNEKVNATIETWEQEPLPHNVTWEQLPDAASAAAGMDRARLHRTADRLEAEAVRGLERVRSLASVDTSATPADDDTLLQIIIGSLLKENETLRSESLKLLNSAFADTAARPRTARRHLGALLHAVRRFTRITGSSTVSR